VGPMSPRCRSLTFCLLALVACGLLPGRAAAAPRVAPLHWSTPAQVDSQQPFAEPAVLSDVACPTSGLCVAVDDRGNALTTTDPATVPATWTAQQVTATGLNQVVCNGTSLCAATGQGGVVAVTTDPAAPAPQWTTTSLPGGISARLQCPTSTQCLAVGVTGQTFVMTLGADGQPAWVPGAKIAVADDPRTGLSDVSCPSSSLCLALGVAGDTYASTDPLDPQAQWAVTRQAFGPCSGCAQDRADSPARITCPAASLCLVPGDVQDPAKESNDPASSAPTWTSLDAAHSNDITALRCSSTTLCFGANLDDQQEAINPSAPAATFAPLGQGQVQGVNLSLASCTPDAALCVGAGDQSTQVLLDPASPSSAWSAPQTIDQAGFSSLRGLACPSAKDCLAVDDAGNELVTDHGAAATPPWRVTPGIDHGYTQRHCNSGNCHAFRAVACPSTHLCVAAGFQALVIASTNPFAASPTWSRPRATNDGRFNAVACPSTHMCVVAGTGAEVSTQPGAANPRYRGIQFTGQPFHGRSSLDGVSCPSAKLCVVVDSQGGITTSRRPADARSKWLRIRVEHGPAVGLSSVSCPSTSLCVAADNFGNVLTTTAPAAVHPHWSVHKVDRAIPQPRAGFGLGSFEAASVSCPSVHRCVMTESADGAAVTSTDPAAAHPRWSRPVLIDGPVDELLQDGLRTPLAGLTVACATNRDCLAVDVRGQALGTR
jgi:hypothetical protein